MAFTYSNDSAGGIQFTGWGQLIPYLADDAAINGVILDSPSGTSFAASTPTTTSVSLTGGNALVGGQVGTLTGATTWPIPDNTSGATRYDALSIRRNAATGVLDINYRVGNSSGYAVVAGEFVLWGSPVPSHASGSPAVTPVLTDRRTYISRRVLAASSVGWRPSAPRVGELLVDGVELLEWDGTVWNLAGTGPWVDVALSTAAPSPGSQATVPLTKTGGCAIHCPVVTSGQITIPGVEGGRWRVQCQAKFNASGSAGQGVLILGVNGSNVLLGRAQVSAAVNETVVLTRDISLSGGDVVIVQISVDSGISLVGSATESWITLARTS